MNSNFQKQVLIIITMFISATFLAGCTNLMGDHDVLYTKYNIHHYTRGGYEIADIRQFVVAKRNSVLPYNTPVSIYPYRNGFVLMRVDGNSRPKVYFEYRKAYSNGISIKDYLALTTATTPVKHKLSPLDNKGVAAGRSYKGMTKEGVLTALGYPAPSETPLLDSDKWYYWYKDSSQQYVVRFENNLVTDIKIK